MPTSLRRLAARVRPTRPGTDHAAPGTAGPPTTARADQESRAAVLERLEQPLPTRPRPGSDVAVAVAASEHVRHGLAWEWAQTNLEPDTWSRQLQEKDHRLLVVEVTATGVADWAAHTPVSELAAVARDRGMRSLAWVTDVPGPGTDLDLSGFDAVRAVDERVAAGLAQRGISADPELLRAATQLRAQGGAHSPEKGRVGDLLFRVEKGAVGRPTSSTGDDDGRAVSQQVRSLSRTELVAHDWTVGDDEGPAPAQPLSSLYRVLVDIGPRRPSDLTPVLDALAAGTAVVTTPDRAEVLAPDLAAVVTVAEPADVRRNATVLARQPEYRDRLAHTALRAVVSGHGYADRARTILGEIDAAPARQDRSVSVVVPTNRPHELTNVLENVARQQRVDTELVLLLHGLEVDEAALRSQARDLGVDALEIRTVDGGATLGAVLNEGLDIASGAHVAKMDDDNYYGAQFLGDLVDAFTYTSAGITGKWCHYVWLRSTGAVVLRFEQHEHAYHRLVQGGSIVATREVAQDIRFSDIPRAVDSDFLNRAMAAGVQTYSGDRYNFVSIRGDDRLSHTWKVDDLVFMTGAGRVVTYGDPRDLVSV